MGGRFDSTNVVQPEATDAQSLNDVAVAGQETPASATNPPPRCHKRPRPPATLLPVAFRGELMSTEPGSPVELTVRPRIRERLSLFSPQWRARVSQ